MSINGRTFMSPLTRLLESLISQPGLALRFSPGYAQVAAPRLHSDAV
jgi:hypothetical protein